MTTRSSGRALIVLMALCAIPLSTLASQQSAPPRDAVARQPTGTAVISGRVVTADATPMPVRRARVTLTTAAFGNGWSATTDDEGRFVVGGLPANRYTVRASKPAWLSAAYGAIRPGGEGTPLSVRDDERLENVVLTMHAGAVITGVVLDRAGQPLPGIGVTVMRSSFSPQTGEASLSTAASATTDDLGVYRAYGLAPGEYVAAAMRSGPSASLVDLLRLSDEDVQRAIADARSIATGSASPSPVQASAAPLVGYAPTYHPGTANASLAARIRVGVGEERGGVDIRLDPVPTARVEATVSLPEPANPASLQVFLVGVQPSRVGAASMTPGRREATGRYVFPGLTPGAYTLVARAAPAPSLPLTLYATADVSVDGRDQIVALDLQPGMNVGGRLAFEGDQSRVPADLGVLQIWLSPIGTGTALTVDPARAAGDGTFRFSGVPAGTYGLSYGSAATFDRWTLKSAMVGGQDVLDTMLKVRAGGAVDDVVLTFTDKPAELAGRLQDATGRPAASYHVIAFAIDRGFWTPFSRRVRETRPDTSGTFLFRGLAPGDYLIAALTDVEPGQWRNPSFLAGLVSAAARVTIRDGARTVQDLMIK